MKIVFAADHGGFALKTALIPFVEELGYETADMGAYELNEKDDYPEFISKAAKAVSNDPENTLGIILGRSGQGEAMLANRFPHVRAAVYHGGNTDILVKTREDNDANMLSLAGSFISEEEAKEAVKLWLETDFTQEPRHVRRLEQIEELTP